MKKELDFFYIGDSYGGNQDWCLDHMMQLGGCGAITACDCSIYFKLRMGEEKAYPGKLTEAMFPEGEAMFPEGEAMLPEGEAMFPEDETLSAQEITQTFAAKAVSEQPAVSDANASAEASAPSAMPSFSLEHPSHAATPVSAAALSEDTRDGALPKINLPKPVQVIDGEITMPENPTEAPFREGPGAVLGIDRDTYIRFTEVMKPYLHPRWSGIDKLYLFSEGLARYYEEHGVTDMEMEEFDGGNELPEAIERVKQQINAGYPIPCLILNHRNPAMEDYIWHWFLLVGYQTDEAEPSDDGAIQSSIDERNEECAAQQANGAIQTGISDKHVRQDVKVQAATRSIHDFYVKTATYSEANWVRFSDLWNTGYPVKGGLILFHKKARHAR